MANNLLLHTFLCMTLCCLAENNGGNPPKIVTKDGNLVLKAGEDGDIVFEPGQGKQVFIGGNVLNVSGVTGAKGEKGDHGIQGPVGGKGDKGEVGPPGQMTSTNGTVNITGHPGQKGEQGIQGIKGEKGNAGLNGTQGQRILCGFYSNDLHGKIVLDYDKWYHVTCTWRKSNKVRKIFINGVLDEKDNAKNGYQGISGKTQIGTWWSGNTGVKTNIEIDTLYIIDKAIDYTSIDQQLCFAKAFNWQMP